MRKKKRAKKKATAAKPSTSRRYKRERLKPPGTRPEDVPPFKLFQYNIDDNEEIHLSVPHEYNYGHSLFTIKLAKNGEDCFEYASIMANNDWDHTIKYIEDKVVRVEVVGGKCVAKIFTKRKSSD